MENIWVIFKGIVIEIKYGKYLGYFQGDCFLINKKYLTFVAEMI